MSEKQQAIFAKIRDLKDRLEDSQCVMDSLHDDCEQLSRERDAATERAEKAERELTEQKERARVGRLHAMETKTRLQKALKQIVTIEANRFPDNSTWRDLASEAIDIARKALTPAAGEEIASPPSDGTLLIKKVNQ